MTAGKWAMGLTATAMVFFVASGVAHWFMPVGVALLVGFAVWIAVAYGFVKGMESK